MFKRGLKKLVLSFIQVTYEVEQLYIDEASFNIKSTKLYRILGGILD